MADEPIITEPFDPFLHLAFRYRCPGANISIKTAKFVLKRTRCATSVVLKKFQLVQAVHACRAPVETIHTMNRFRCANSKAIAAASLPRQHVVHAITCFSVSTVTNTKMVRINCGSRRVIEVGSWQHKRTRAQSLITYASMSVKSQRGCISVPRVPQQSFSRTVKPYDCRVTSVLVPVSAKICNSIKSLAANTLRYSRVFGTACRTMPITLNFSANRNCVNNMHFAVRATFNWQVAVRLMSCRQSVALVLRPAFKTCAVAKPMLAKNVIHRMYRRQPITCKSIAQLLDSRKAFKICNSQTAVGRNVFKQVSYNGVISCRTYPSFHTVGLQKFRCGTIILGTAPLLVYGRVWGGVGLVFTPRSSGRVNGDFKPE